MTFKGFISQLLVYADINEPVNKIISGLVKNVIGITLIVGALLFHSSLFYFILGTILAPIAVFGTFLAILYFQGVQRANVTEEVLPEALVLMSTNLKSGLTPDRALLMTARPEFGPLEKELKFVAKESLTTVPFEDAIMEVAKKFNSMTILRTLKLISEGIKRGGEMSAILENTANHIREVSALKKQIGAEVMLQVLFILFASIVAAPLMFGTSTVIIEKITSLGTSTAVQAPQGMGANLPQMSRIGPAAAYMLQYAVGAIAVNSLFASMIIGLIQDGKKVSGIKFFPVIVAISILIMFTTRYMMGLALNIA
jgi:pilus assembly protein TadC